MDRVLRRLLHVQRMDEYRMARNVLMAEVTGVQVRGKLLRFGWIDGVKVAFGSRGTTLEAARQCGKRRSVEPKCI